MRLWRSLKSERLEGLPEVLRHFDGERSIVRMQQSRERAQLVLAGAGLTGVPADGSAVRCSERAAELVLGHPEDAAGLSQDEVNRSRRGSGHWFRQSGERARDWQAKRHVVGTSEGQSNVPSSDDGAPAIHEGTSAAAVGISRRHIGTYNGDATPWYTLRGTRVSVPGMFIEKKGTWVGVGGTSVHDGGASDARPGASVAPWLAFYGGRNATVDDGCAAIEQPSACVDEPRAAIEQPSACVDEPRAAIEQPSACVDEPRAAVVDGCAFVRV
jgi:hypothetical protein